jgi:predicted membrane-bound mannosyltransferase
MWQRIQTLFLVILILAVLVSLVVPVWSAEVNGEARVLTAFYYLNNGAYQYNPYSLTAILAIAAVTIALMEISKFKNRLTQVKLGALNSLFLVGVLVCTFYFSNQLMKGLEGTKGQYGLGMWLPFLAVVCNLLANRFIRRDEKLVRDSDRLR